MLGVSGRGVEGRWGASPERLEEAAAPTLRERAYHGCRQQDGSCEVWVEESAVTGSGFARRALPLCLDIREHSPTGFQWGYSGSGPAQLALALLFDVIGDREIAERYYQSFKREFVVGFPASWSITGTQIREFVAKEHQDDLEGE